MAYSLSPSSSVDHVMTTPPIPIADSFRMISTSHDHAMRYESLSMIVSIHASAPAITGSICARQAHNFSTSVRRSASSSSSFISSVVSSRSGSSCPQ